MITVNTPDGGVAQFPDGTPPETIKSALAKKFPPSLPPNMARAKAAGEGTFAPDPSGVARANAFTEANSGDLEDATKMGRIDALGRGLHQGLTFGFGDEMVAALRPLIHEGETYDSALAGQRNLLSQAREDRPGYAYGGEIAGGIASPVNAALPLGKAAGSLASRAASSAMAGGSAGALYGFGSGEGGGGDRLASATIGGLLGGGIGAAIPAIGAGVQRVSDKSATRRQIADLVRNAPTTEELRRSGRAAYDAIDAEGLQISPDAARRGLADIADSLMSEGVKFDRTGKVLPGAKAIADAAGEIGVDGAPVPLREIDMFRRFAGNAAGANPANRADTRLASNAVSGLDDMVDNLTPADVTAGDIDAIKTLLPKARDLWARMSRSQKIDDAIEAGDNYLSGPASGIRNQFANILRNPKLSRSFSDGEKQVMRRVAQGSLPEQAIHLAGGGMANLLSIVGGGAGGGLPGAALATAGAAGLRKASEAIVRRNAEVARAVIASGGLRSAPQASPAVRNIAEALLMRGLRPTAPTFAQQGLLQPARE
ncbi:MAG: hypothetical protein RL268_816 [Pseudomonadota bacterium]|jgi:hypothetical protein